MKIQTLPILPGSAAGAAAPNPARGPLAVSLPYGVSLLSVGERGRRPLPATTPPHHVSPKTPAFYGVLCSSHFWPFFGSCGPRWANTGQHSAQDGPTWPPRWANIAPSWANIAPRWANIAPRWAKIAPRWANIAPRWAHIALKIRQHSPKMGQHSPKIGRRPSKYPAFYSDFLLFPFFGSFGSTWVHIGLKIGPHSFQDKPT